MSEEKALQGIVSDNSKAEKQERESTNVNSRTSLIRTLMRGPDARARLVESHISKGLAFQLRSLRDERGWSQQEVAEKIGSNQNAVCRAENPRYGKQTITTLKKMAAAYDVALVVRFVPFSQLIDWISGTPYLDRGLRSDALEVPLFQGELEAGIFEEKKTEHR